MSDVMPEWQIGNPLVARGLRLIRAGYLRDRPTKALAERLGVSPAELRTAFVDALGATAHAVAASHYRDIRAQLKSAGRDDRLRLTQAVLEPYDANWVFGFLDKRSLPGLEEVKDGVYRRRLAGTARDEWLEVSYAPGELRIDLPRAARTRSVELMGRVAHVFDVHADPHLIDQTLRTESWLSDRVTGGIRVPGAWNGFETAVRAILGQQVSVSRARTLAIDLMQRFGSSGFPEPAELVDADVSAIGMPGKRGAAVRELAGAVLDGRLVLDNAELPERQYDALCALPGIGPWTAGYVAMRIAGDANAFPRGDWVILKQLGMTAAVAQRYSAAWEPWRAYALMYIWQASAG